MKGKISSLLFSAASLLLVVATAAGEPAQGSPLSQLVEAERDFAKASATKGRNAAFLDHLADECLVFNKAWLTKGRQYFRDQQPGPVILKWEPEFADISASGDFGVTTGPWEVQEYRPGTQPLMKGYFLTVWQKQADGAWKVILDNGAIMNVPEKNEHAVSFPEGADKLAKAFKAVDAKAVSAELKKTDSRFLEAWKKEPVPDTYLSFLAPDCRMMRPETLPAITVESVDKMLAEEDRLATWICAGSGAAPSGDLGFTYGLFTRQSEEKYAEGSYVRIWKKQTDGTFKILIEMVSFD